MPTTMRTRLAGMKRELAFAIYCSLRDRRSLARVRADWGSSGATGRPPGQSTLEAWSAEHGWVDRAREYDESVAAEVMEEQITEDAQAVTGQRRVGSAILNTAARSIASLNRPDDPFTLPVHLIPLWAKTGMDMERIAMGLDTARTTVRVEFGSAAIRTLDQIVDRLEGLIASDAALRLRREFRELIVAMITEASPQADLPMWMTEAVVASITGDERADIAAVLDARRTGRPMPEFGAEDYPELPPPGKYLADE